jgi:hypothetical protein
VKTKPVARRRVRDVGPVKIERFAILRNHARRYRTAYRRRSAMIRKLKDGQYRLYSRNPDPKTKKRRNLGTFKTRAAAEKHEREVQYFKRHG